MRGKYLSKSIRSFALIHATSDKQKERKDALTPPSCWCRLISRVNVT